MKVLNLNRQGIDKKSKKLNKLLSTARTTITKSSSIDIILFFNVLRINLYLGYEVDWLIDWFNDTNNYFLEPNINMDIMPYDFFEEFFDYRKFLDLRKAEDPDKAKLMEVVQKGIEFHIYMIIRDTSNLKKTLLENQFAPYWIHYYRLKIFLKQPINSEELKSQSKLFKKSHLDISYNLLP